MRERKLNRLQGYDYSTPGAYFLTICVHQTYKGLNVFGEIRNGEMILNEHGKIVEQQWNWLFGQYAYIETDEFIVMPDHFHGIIHIVNGTHHHFVRNGRDRSVQNYSLHYDKIKPIPELIGAFKTTSSKLIHRTINPSFRWQKSYHDHIIRDDDELHRIRQYVKDNPVNWGNGNDIE